MWNSAISTGFIFWASFKENKGGGCFSPFYWDSKNWYFIWQKWLFIIIHNINLQYLDVLNLAYFCYNLKIGMNYLFLIKKYKYGI